jgi:hypothetical protein
MISTTSKMHVILETTHQQASIITEVLGINALGKQMRRLANERAKKYLEPRDISWQKWDAFGDDEPNDTEAIPTGWYSISRCI